MKKIVVIKNKLDSNNSSYNAEILKFAQISFEDKVERKYYTNTNDSKILSEKNVEDGIVMLVSYNNMGKISFENLDIKKIYIGTMHVCKDERELTKCNITYQMKRKIQAKEIIINLLDSLELDLGNDFSNNSYLLISKSKELENLLTDLMCEEIKPDIVKEYHDVDDNYVLDEYAQHNSQCKRMYGILEEDKLRNEFQRDRERIVNSKAFRRLVDKAQIFSAEKGDHYRTRMTHTLEVNQISKAIAGALRLNLDLTEAIALAHDLGHTPFGHQGERTLYNILSGKQLRGIFHLSDDLWHENIFGGFKHNFQGVRVLASLEEKYIDYQGLDVSLQVMEGVLKHTELKEADINDYIDEKFVSHLHLELKEGKDPVATTLEGQVVAVADEIAQRGHDIDDAISSGLITIDELMEVLSAPKFKVLYNMLMEEKNNIEKRSRIIVDKRELLTGRIISVIVGFLINDVINYSREQMKDYIKEKDYFNKCLIKLSPKEGGTICGFLKKVVNKRVISNAEVAMFDYNGGVIISKLFEIYYTNPKLLHKGTLRRIYIDQLNSKNSDVSTDAVDLINGNMEVVRNEIKNITQKPLNDLNDKDQKKLFDKRKILVRNIADYIAGMTDSYAIREYEKIR